MRTYTADALHLLGMSVFADSRLEFGCVDGYASGLGGQSAIPRPVDENSAALAQLVEHRIRNAGVVGSNPIGGTSLRKTAKKTR